jgi:hypothetical protein
MKWMKHDSDAHRDPKIRKLRRVHGLEGVGLYWTILELIVADISESNLTFQLEHDSEMIAEDVGITRDRVEAMMRTMVELDLFESMDGVIRCMKLGQRLMQSQASTPKMRKMIADLNQNQLKYDGYVYLIQVSGSDPKYKVGKSANPYARIEDLRRHQMIPGDSSLVVVGKMYSENAFEQERELHKKLSAYALGNEFFAPHHDVPRICQEHGLELRHDVVMLTGDESVTTDSTEEKRTEQNRTEFHNQDSTNSDISTEYLGAPEEIDP